MQQTDDFVISKLRYLLAISVLIPFRSFRGGDKSVIICIITVFDSTEVVFAVTGSFLARGYISLNGYRVIASKICVYTSTPRWRPCIGSFCCLPFVIVSK